MTKAHPLDDYDTRRRYWKMKIDKEDRKEAQFLKKIKSYLERQKKEILESLNEKAYKKDVIDDDFNIEIEAKIAKDEFLPFLRETLEEEGASTVEFSGGKAFVLSSQIESTLNKRADLFTQSMNKTTFDRLKREMKEGIENGENNRQLAKRIEGTYDDISKGRAGTIARTEVGVAMQTGTFEGYKQSGVESKVWTAVMDSVTRDTHQALDGEKVPMNQPFSNGLQHPRDPFGPIAEVANCRCVL